jgi:hypothetical protein
LSASSDFSIFSGDDFGAPFPSFISSCRLGGIDSIRFASSLSAFSSWSGVSSMKIRPDDEESDYALFGKIVLLWGQVEERLVNIILHLNHPLFKPMVEFTIPMGFEDKVTFTQRRYQEIQELRPLASRAQKLLAKLKPLHKTRTQIVHGDYQGYHPPDTYLFHFYHSKKKEQNRLGVFSFSSAELDKLTSDLFEAKIEIEEFSRATFLIPPPSSRKAKR